MPVIVSGGMPGPLSSKTMRVGFAGRRLDFALPVVIVTLMTGATSASSQASMLLSTSSLVMTLGHS